MMAGDGPDQGIWLPDPKKDKHMPLVRALLVKGALDKAQEDERLLDDLNFYLRLESYAKDGNHLHAVKFFLGISPESYHYADMLAVFQESCDFLGLKSDALRQDYSSVIQQSGDEAKYKFFTDLESKIKILEHYHNKEYMDAIELFLGAPGDSYYYEEMAKAFKDSCDALGGKDKILLDLREVLFSENEPLGGVGFLALMNFIKGFKGKCSEIFPEAAALEERVPDEVVSLGGEFSEVDLS